jgi:Gametolysin peptidase M11
MADPPDTGVTVSGTLERTHEDTANGPNPITVLATPSGPRIVKFAPDQPVPPNGAQVQLQGSLKGTTFEASSATLAHLTLAVPTTVAADGGNGQTAVGANQGTPLASGTPRSVAIVVITFAGGAPPAYSDAFLQGVLVSNSNSVSNYFSEQSYGAVSFRGLTNAAGDVFHATIAADGSGCNSTTSNTAGWPTWGSQAQAAVGASTLARYDHVIYVFNSHNTCGWAGLGYMPGREVYIDNAFQLSVVAHELGHNLGVHHASSLRCIAGGQPVAFSTVSGACSSSEYGDPYDIMGNSATNQQNAFHKLQSGWLGGTSGGRVKTITASGDYTVTPLEQSSGVALLLVPNVTGGAIGQDFALDLRQAYGSYFDAFAAGSPATAGVEIHLVQTPGSGSPIQTQLIDTTPQTSTFNDAALVPGATFSDSTDRITIQTLSVDPLVGATVRVTLGDAPASDTTPPTAVSNLAATVASGPEVTLSYAAAADSGGVASYRVTRDGAPIATLGSSSTSYPDWTPSYGTHTYGVAAVDQAGNVGPTTTVAAVVPAPPPPPPTTPTTPAPKLGVKIPAAKVKAKIVKGRGSKRRVLLSWRPVAGVRSYLVLRNGQQLTVTRKHKLVDNAPPHGKLRYVVRSTG